MEPHLLNRMHRQYQLRHLRKMEEEEDQVQDRWFFDRGRGAKSNPPSSPPKDGGRKIGRLLRVFRRGNGFDDIVLITKGWSGRDPVR